MNVVHFQVVEANETTADNADIEGDFHTPVRPKSLPLVHDTTDARRITRTGRGEKLSEMNRHKFQDNNFPTAKSVAGPVARADDAGTATESESSFSSGIDKVSL